MSNYAAEPRTAGVRHYRKLKHRTSTGKEVMILARGTKRQVYEGKAIRTSGGLTKAKLMKTKAGKIVSKKQHAAGLAAKKYLGAYLGRISNLKKKKHTSKRAGAEFADEFEPNYGMPRYAGMEYQPRFAGAESYAAQYQPYY